MTLLGKACHIDGRKIKEMIDGGFGMRNCSIVEEIAGGFEVRKRSIVEGLNGVLFHLWGFSSFSRL